MNNTYTWTQRKKVETGETFENAFTGMLVSQTKTEERQMVGVLTTDHARSSYGIPVFVVDGVAYGPHDVVVGTEDKAGAIVNSLRESGDDLAAKFVRTGVLS